MNAHDNHLCRDASGAIVLNTREGIALNTRIWFDEAFSTSRMVKFQSRKAKGLHVRFCAREERGNGNYRVE